MAEIITKRHICDIDKCEGDPTDDGGIKALSIDVIFTTEQTEGKACDPYLSRETIDLCPKHYANLLKGNYVFAYGAQGYDTYYFKINL